MLRIALILFGVSTSVAACGGDDERATSEYPGEMGASCEDKADCDGDLLCTATLDPETTYAYCFRSCDDAHPCPEGSFCALAQEPVASAGGFAHICERACDSTAFCRSLNPDATACKNFTGNPEGKLSCGIKG